MSEITFQGCEGYETYVIDEKKMIIGVRPKWISVNKPPQDDYPVLVVDKFDLMYVAEYSRIYERWMIRCNCHEGSYAYPTHWMPIPEKPKDEKTTKEILKEYMDRTITEEQEFS